MFTNDIVGSSLGQNGVRDPHTVRLFAEGVPSTRRPPEAATRRTIGGENDSPRAPARPLRQGGRRARADTAWTCGSSTGATATCAAATTSRSSSAAIPAARFTEPNEDYRHQHQDVRVENGVQFGDLPEFVDFGYIARVARVNAATARGRWPARPRRQPNVRVHTGQLTNDTDARVERRTPSPTWRATRSSIATRPSRTGRTRSAVGNVTSYTVDLTKDNFFFGVRAVDRDGHRSPVSFPRPVP